MRKVVLLLCVLGLVFGDSPDAPTANHKLTEIANDDLLEFVAHHGEAAVLFVSPNCPHSQKLISIMAGISNEFDSPVAVVDASTDRPQHVSTVPQLWWYAKEKIFNYTGAADKMEIFRWLVSQRESQIIEMKSMDELNQLKAENSLLLLQIYELPCELCSSVNSLLKPTAFYLRLNNVSDVKLVSISTSLLGDEFKMRENLNPTLTIVRGDQHWEYNGNPNPDALIPYLIAARTPFVEELTKDGLQNVLDDQKETIIFICFSSKPLLSRISTHFDSMKARIPAGFPRIYAVQDLSALKEFGAKDGDVIIVKASEQIIEGEERSERLSVNFDKVENLEQDVGEFIGEKVSAGFEELREDNAAWQLRSLCAIVYSDDPNIIRQLKETLTPVIQKFRENIRFLYSDPKAFRPALDALGIDHSPSLVLFNMSAKYVLTNLRVGNLRRVEEFLENAQSSKIDPIFRTEFDPPSETIPLTLTFGLVRRMKREERHRTIGLFLMGNCETCENARETVEEVSKLAIERKLDVRIGVYNIDKNDPPQEVNYKFNSIPALATFDENALEFTGPFSFEEVWNFLETVSRREIPHSDSLKEDL